MHFDLLLCMTHILCIVYMLRVDLRIRPTLIVPAKHPHGRIVK